MSPEKYVIPFEVTDWSMVSSTAHPGETGVATWKTLQLGGLRIRMVEYSENYLADHWCEKGHLLFVLDGEMITELKDGNRFHMTKGISYQVSDELSSHRSFSATGAKLLIVDGSFLAS
jgi:hypothetical protein